MSPDRAISPAEAHRLLPGLSGIVAQAGALILQLTASSLPHRLKADQSPVTAADEASEAEILQGLARLMPSVPVVSEENAGRSAPAKLGRSFVMVDPLDGTKEFIAGSDEFTVNLAIVSDGAPIAGIVAAPKRGLLWRGVVGMGAERLRLSDNTVAELQPIRTRRWLAQEAVATMSRSHLDPATQVFLDRLGPLTRKPSGSAVKFCLIAEGAVDVYPRLAPTCEWDVAAGHALLAAAGGIVTAPDGAALPYGRIAQSFRVPAFIACGDIEKARAITG